jgi:hypothetical protein
MPDRFSDNYRKSVEVNIMAEVYAVEFLFFPGAF